MVWRQYAQIGQGRLATYGAAADIHAGQAQDALGIRFFGRWGWRFDMECSADGRQGFGLIG